MRMIMALLIFVGFISTAIAVEIGEDGLHKQPWFATTFKDVLVAHVMQGVQQSYATQLKRTAPALPYTMSTYRNRERTNA